MEGVRRALRVWVVVVGCLGICLGIPPVQADDPSGVPSAAVVVVTPFDPVDWLERELRTEVDSATEGGSYWSIESGDLEEWLAALRQAYAHARQALDAQAKPPDKRMQPTGSP